MSEVDEKTKTILEMARQLSLEEGIKLTEAIELLKVEALWKIIEYM